MSSLEREEIKQIELTANVEYATDYTKATLKVGTTYEGNIIQIKIILMVYFQY